jgi:Coenzyme PQQ synthesis protein D (PqqD)
MHMLTTRFVKGTGCVTRRVADETILVPVRAHVVDLDAIYTLNEVGTFIWEQVDGHTSVPQVVERLCETYDVAPETALPDVAAFLHTLQAAGFIMPAQS